MASQKLLWVCELNKDQPSKVWKAADVMELEDEEDTDFVINSLVLKTAVLGKAVENERNLVAIKAKGYQDAEFEQPIFSLTMGKNDMVSGMDLTLASDHNSEIEFKLVEGTGPVFITCNHVIEMPAPEEQQTIMTASDGDLEESLEEEEEEMEDEEEEEEKGKGKGKKNGTANGKNGHANGKNGKMANGKNGDHVNGTNGKKEEVEIEEKPTKRRRN